MTAKSYRKPMKQLKTSTKVKKYLKNNKPVEKKYGRGKNRCILCGRFGAHLSRYGLHICRQCFRERAKELGFKKYR